MFDVTLEHTQARARKTNKVTRDRGNSTNHVQLSTDLPCHPCDAVATIHIWDMVITTSNQKQCHMKLTRALSQKPKHMDVRSRRSASAKHSSVKVLKVRIVKTSISWRCWMSASKLLLCRASAATITIRRIHKTTCQRQCEVLSPCLSTAHAWS